MLRIWCWFCFGERTNLTNFFLWIFFLSHLQNNCTVKWRKRQFISVSTGCCLSVSFLPYCSALWNLIWAAGVSGLNHFGGDLIWISLKKKKKKWDEISKHVFVYFFPDFSKLNLDKKSGIAKKTDSGWESEHSPSVQAEQRSSDCVGSQRFDARFWLMPLLLVATAPPALSLSEPSWLRFNVWWGNS